MSSAKRAPGCLAEVVRGRWAALVGNRHTQELGRQQSTLVVDSLGDALRYTAPSMKQHCSRMWRSERDSAGRGGMGDSSERRGGRSSNI